MGSRKSPSARSWPCPSEEVPSTHCFGSEFPFFCAVLATGITFKNHEGVEAWSSHGEPEKKKGQGTGRRRRDVARSMPHAWRRPVMQRCGVCCRDVAYAIRYHLPTEQACAAEMWRMPFCMHGQCRPVLQRCGAQCKFPSVQLRGSSFG